MNIKNTTKINKNLYIGFFDGIHQGHLQLFELQKDADVLTFLKIPRKSPSIYTLEQRVNALKEVGFKNIYIYDIENNNMSAYSFVNDVLIQKGVKNLYVGDDFKLGNNQVLVDDIKKYINVIKIKKNQYSTTRIKELMSEGNIKEVNKELINPYFIFGKVVQGNKIASTKLGFPTANIKTDQHVYLKEGVYLTKTKINHKIYNSITFVGKSKTFNLKELSIETHILNFDKDIYNQTIDVYFFEYLSEVFKFKSIDELKKHIQKIIEIANKKINIIL